MAKKELIGFIRENIAKGFDAMSIRDHLVRSGFDVREVDEAFQLAMGSSKKQFPLVLIFGIIFVVVVLGIFGYFYLVQEPDANPVGDQGTCFDRLKNNGEAGIDCGGPCRKCAASPQDAAPIINQTASHPSIPENNPPPSRSSADGSEARPSWEILNEIHGIALQDPDEAARQCDLLEKADNRDYCFLDIAEITGSLGNCRIMVNTDMKDGCFSAMAKKNADSSICSFIEYPEQRDVCYMDFVLKGDYALCDNIATDYYKTPCAILRSQ